MSPRGYYSRESVNPYFTSHDYKYTDQYKQNVKVYTTMSNRVKAILGYPGKIIKKLIKH